MGDAMELWQRVSSSELMLDVMTPGRKQALLLLRQLALGVPAPNVAGATASRVRAVAEAGPPELLSLVAEDKLAVQTAEKAVSYLTVERIIDLASSPSPQSSFAAAVNAAMPGHYAEFRKPKGDRKVVEVVARSVLAVS